MTSAYHPEKWNVTKNLFIWQFRLSGRELPGWTLAEMKSNQHFMEHPVQEYYWKQNEKNTIVKIDVISAASWKNAQEIFRNLLQEHMITQLPTVPDKIALLGDVAYTGPSEELRSMLFLRANMIVRINSIGREIVKTDQPSLEIDNLFTRKEFPREGKIKPEIRLFEPENRETPAGRPTALNIRAEDPLQRHLWYRFVTDNGEIVRQGDNVIYTPEKSGEGRITVQAISMEGDADEKSIPIKIL